MKKQKKQFNKNNIHMENQRPPKFVFKMYSDESKRVHLDHELHLKKLEKRKQKESENNGKRD